jgi:hypothetical protein
MTDRIHAMCVVEAGEDIRRAVAVLVSVSNR